jgi:hypothetical protein
MTKIINKNTTNSCSIQNTIFLDTQNALILDKLILFFETGENINKMIEIIQGYSKVSLRLIDWFTTNYSKEKFIVYGIKNNDNEIKRFKVYNEYKLQLKSYRKKRFDPFCRWERIGFPYTKTKKIETTIGQLNFFKWAIENDVINYIEQNYEKIEDDMNKRNSLTRKREGLGLHNKQTRKKREELSISASKSIKKENVEITINFN